jgi:hypothetical protein
VEKEALTKLLREQDGNYPILLQRAKESAASEKWGMGVGAPYSLEPYCMEMLGIKPGRMLKSKSEPGARRYRYFYDNKDRVVHVVAYSKLGGPPDARDCMRADDFYEYDGNSATRYVFGNAFREHPDSQITRIVRLSYVNEKVCKIYQLETRNLEYTETVYSYNKSGDLVEIRVKWPDGPYPDRVLKVNGEGEDVKLFEIRDQREIPVYPEP